jgi:hypothetical protein
LTQIYLQIQEDPIAERVVGKLSRRVCVSPTALSSRTKPFY